MSDKPITPHAGPVVDRQGRLTYLGDDGLRYVVGLPPGVPDPPDPPDPAIAGETGDTTGKGTGGGEEGENPSDPGESS